MRADERATEAAGGPASVHGTWRMGSWRAMPRPVRVRARARTGGASGAQRGEAAKRPAETFPRGLHALRRW